MNVKARLQQDLTEAMRAGDSERRSVIRMALTAIKNAEVDKRGELTEEEAVTVLVGEAKKRRDSIAELETARRAEMAERERRELAILESYLPQQLDRDALVAAAQKAIAEVGASSLKDIGNVMRVLMPRVKGRADGRVVNEVVRELLS